MYYAARGYSTSPSEFRESRQHRPLRADIARMKRSAARAVKATTVRTAVSRILGS